MTIDKGSALHDMHIKKSPGDMRDILKELEEKGGELSNIHFGAEYLSLFFKETSPSRGFSFKGVKTSSSLWYSQDSESSLSSPAIWKKKLELLKSLDTLRACFDDSIELHIQYFRFKEELEELRDNVESNQWDLLRLVIGCIDAVSNTESEDLTLTQIEAFRRVFKDIEEDIDCSTVNSLLGVLISAGLKPVPPLKNLELIEGLYLH